jgi:hypothetical protein
MLLGSFVLAHACPAVMAITARKVKILIVRVISCFILLSLFIGRCAQNLKKIHFILIDFIGF